MDLTSTDTVRVRIPASPAYLRVVRLVVADLASRLGFTIDEIEDLKIAVDELAAYMTGSQGREGSLEIVATVDRERIEISGKGHFIPGSRVRTELTDFSRTILETVADTASLQQVDGTPTFELVKIKGR
jgi:anti-sigma regulatory factor (Ser/Thr protein kinase)